MSARKVRLLLTERAISDIREIEAYSIAEWGKRTASRYISDLEAALERVREKPDLLRAEEGLHPELCFYRGGTAAPKAVSEEKTVAGVSWSPKSQRYEVRCTRTLFHPTRRELERRECYDVDYHTTTFWLKYP